MGCPVNKVVKSGAGSALLKTPEKIYDIVKSLKENLDIPVTIKIRAGWDNNTINCDEVAKLASKAGVDAADSPHALPPFDETAEGTRSRKESESRQALPDDTAEWDQVLVAGSGGTDQEQEPGSADDAAKTLTHLAPPPTIRTSDEAAATRP